MVSDAFLSPEPLRSGGDEALRLSSTLRDFRKEYEYVGRSDQID